VRRRRALRNTASSDGCSSTCAFELVPETDNNDTAETAGPARRPAFLRSGAIDPMADVDFYAIELPATSDLHIETFDEAGPGTCAGIDTQITLFAPDRTTAILVRDQGGIGTCSKIDSTRPTDTAARHLAAGTYYVKVETFRNATTANYTLLVTYDAQCGDEVVQGAEECDGGTGCTTTCDRMPS
jgi:hypothetical protein